FGISLLIVALLYLPLRDMLTRRIVRHREADRDRLFQSVIDVALAPPGADQNARWRQVLTAAFEPLHMEAGLALPAPAILDDGLALGLPGYAGLPPVKLNYARGGKHLFSRADASLATELLAMLRHSIESRDAYEKGVAEERTRIARDMH